MIVIMKLTIVANYLVVTDAADNFKFRAPTKLVRIEELSATKVKIYTENTSERQNHQVIVDPATATDGAGAALTGGLVTWLMTNTGE